MANGRCVWIIFVVFGAVWQQSDAYNEFAMSENQVCTSPQR